MLLVFVLVIILFLFLVLFTQICINVNSIKVSNLNNERKFIWDYNIKLELYFCNRIKIFQVPIYKAKLAKSRRWNKLKKQLNKKQNWSLKQVKLIVRYLKELKIDVEKFCFNLSLGTENVIITSFIVAFIASSIGILIGNFIKNYNENLYYYKIRPLYKNENIVDMKFSCIIKVKLIHIIYVIYKFSKIRSDMKDEPTSHRRSYDYSYE